LKVERKREGRLFAKIISKMATKSSSASLYITEDTTRKGRDDLTANKVSPISKIGPKDTNVDLNIMDFGEKDDQNPRDWPLWRKWCIVMLVATMFMLKYVVFYFIFTERIHQYYPFQTRELIDIGQ
jgi:hypothetical protein